MTLNNVFKPFSAIVLSASILLFNPLSAREIETIYVPVGQTTVFRYINTHNDRLTFCDDDLELFASVVMGECGFSEPDEGVAAVAECLLNAYTKDGKNSLSYILDEYKYFAPRIPATIRVKAICEAVIAGSLVVLGDDVLYFYSPDNTTSSWHESQTFAREIGGHRFFERAGR